MTPREPYAYFREVVQSDLPYFAQCMGAGTGLPYGRWNNIYESLLLQYKDEEDTWRPTTRVMVVEGRPVFLLEMVQDILFFTGPPSWREHPRRMMLAWQASLVYFFLRMGFQEVKVIVEEYQSGELIALERLGCRKESIVRHRSGSQYRFVCRVEDFMPVI